MSQINKSVLEWLGKLRTTIEYYDFYHNVVFYHLFPDELYLDCDFSLNNNNMKHIQMDVWPSDVLTWKQDLQFECCAEVDVILEQTEIAKDKNLKVEEENERKTVVRTNKAETIREKLLRFLGKRASREYLESKGIFKNEPVFGNYLTNINSNEGIPFFLRKIVEILEWPINIQSVGLYRASGNLAVIQKIRFAIDNNKLTILEEYSNDPDVLAGTCKLFFRELKEPLIPFPVAQQILSNNVDIADVLEKQLSKANRNVLKFLMRHLINVANCRRENKMNFYNLAVCWGPSLITIPDNCSNIVTETANVSKVVECLLNHFYNFKL